MSKTKVDRRSLDYLVGRDATLQKYEDFRREFSSTYDSAIEAIVTLDEIVEKSNGKGKEVWTKQLHKIRMIIPLVTQLQSDNARIRGSFDNLYEQYSMVLDRYNELEAKYNSLTEKLMNNE